MDPTVLAAIITAVGAIIAIVIGSIIQHRKERKPEATSTDADKEAEPPVDETSAVQFARRYTDQPSHVRFIEALPKLKAVVYETAQKGWDTGITADMREASYDVIDFLEFAWLRLAEFYPPSHFGGKDAKTYIKDFIKDRFSFHWSKHEPNGPGTGGTIVGVLTGGDVIHDLEEMIADTVQALFMYNDDFKYHEWVEQWRNSK